jgi:hypothetical protein
MHPVLGSLSWLPWHGGKKGPLSRRATTSGLSTNANLVGPSPCLVHGRPAAGGSGANNKQSDSCYLVNSVGWLCWGGGRHELKTEGLHIEAAKLVRVSVRPLRQVRCLTACMTRRPRASPLGRLLCMSNKVGVRSFASSQPHTRAPGRRPSDGRAVRWLQHGAARGGSGQSRPGLRVSSS